MVFSTAGTLRNTRAAPQSLSLIVSMHASPGPATGWQALACMFADDQGMLWAGTVAGDMRSLTGDLI